MPIVDDQAPTKGALRTFVGGLPYHCEEHELRLFMEKFGTVEHIYISKDGGGQHKGFAFVDFSSTLGSANVFGEHSFKSKTIEVKRNLLNQLFMSNLPANLTDSDIQSAIESLGFPVAEALLGDGTNGIPVGAACVRLKDDNQVSNVAPSGVLIIKDEVVTVLAKANKVFAKSPNESATKKKINKKLSQANAMKFNSKNSIPQPFDFTRLVGGSPENFPDHDVYGMLQMSYPKLTVSDVSTTDYRDGVDQVSTSGTSKLRKFSGSLLASSKEFTSIPKKVEPLELKTQEFPVRLFIELGDSYSGLTASRHYSECVQDIDQLGPSLPRRLNSFSSSFYSTSGSLMSSGLTPSRECKISYFTFPGRD